MDHALRYPDLEMISVNGDATTGRAPGWSADADRGDMLEDIGTRLAAR